MDKDIEIILNDYYNNYNEDARLFKDKAHSVEFITTTRYIDKYLEKDDRILEVGAGTGRYSIYYAQKGYKVDSVELVNKNLDILKSKITNDIVNNIKAVQGNCNDLHMYDDNTFDITLVLGPMYHLFDEEDIDKAISEAKRVTKVNGKIIFAYITDDEIVFSYGLRKGNLKKVYEMSNKTWNIPNIKEEVFATYKVKDFNKLMKKHNLKNKKTVAADGLAPKVREDINKLDDETFKIYLDYHFKNCERKDLIGYSTHIIEIVEKR